MDFKKSIVVKAVVLNSAGSILLLKRSNQHSFPGVWELPGGKVENNDDISTSLKREIEEELGVRISTAGLFHEAENSRFFLHFYLVQGEFDTLTLSSEHDAYKWFLPPDLKEASHIADYFLEKVFVEKIIQASQNLPLHSKV